MIEMEARDVQASYVGSYAGWDSGDGIVPVYIDAVAQDSELTNPRVRIRKVDAGRRSSMDLNNPRLVLEYPDIGNVLVDGTVYYMQRAAKRQWIRGIRVDNITAYSLQPTGKRRPARVASWWDAVAYMYAKPFDTYKPETCVLDNNIAVSYAGIPAVYYRGYPVAEIVDDTIHVFKDCGYLTNYIRGLVDGHTDVVQRTT